MRSDLGSCPEDCEHVDTRVVAWCQKYLKRIYRSAVTGTLIRLPRCINDEASNRLDKGRGD